MRRPIFTCLLFLLATLWLQSSAWAQPAPKAPPIPMELQAFREYIAVSSLTETDSPDILLAEVPCDTRLCMQLGLFGLSRNRLMARISGLVTGFGYGADIQTFSFASSQTDFSKVNLQVVVPPGAPRLTSGDLQTRAQRFLALLHSITALSDPSAKYDSPEQIPAGSPIYLMLAFRWEHRGQSGNIRLLSPPGAPKPVLPQSPGCPIWSLDSVPSSVDGPFVKWQQHDMHWTFDCPRAKDNVE